MIADMINNKKINLVVSELFLEEENLIFQLYLLQNHSLKYQKMFN